MSNPPTFLRSMALLYFFYLFNHYQKQIKQIHILSEIETKTMKQDRQNIRIDVNWFCREVKPVLTSR